MNFQGPPSGGRIRAEHIILTPWQKALKMEVFNNFIVAGDQVTEITLSQLSVCWGWPAASKWSNLNVRVGFGLERHHVALRL